MRFFLFPLLLFLLFPYVGIIPGIDVQPLFFLYGVFVVTLFAYRIKISVPALLGLICIYLLILIRFLFELDYLTAKYIGTYSLSVLTPILIYILVINKLLVVRKRHLLYATAAYIIVGVVQIFSPNFLAGLVARSVEQIETLKETGRGIRSLASEPSNYGKILGLFNLGILFFLFQERKNNIVRRAVFISFFLLFMSAITAQSAYAVGFHLVLISLLLFTLGKGKYATVILGVLVTVLVGYDTVLSESDSRIVLIFQALFNNPEFIMAQGAFDRLMNIPISINNAIQFGLFGAGNSPLSYPTSIYTVFGVYEYRAINRNLGGFVEYILKFGILSFPIYILYGMMLFKISKIRAYINGNRYRIGLFLSIMLFLYSFQDGSPVNPLTWFLIIYIYYYRDIFNKAFEKRNYSQEKVNEVN